MNIIDLKNNILNKTLPKFTVVVTEEFGLVDDYINKIKQLYPDQVSFYDTVDDYLNTITRKNLFLVDTSKVIIVKEDQNFINADEGIWRLASDTRKSLILFYSSLDTKSDFAKTYKDSIITYKTLPVSDIIPWIKTQLPELKDNYINILLDWTGNDYARIKNEVAKLKLFPHLDVNKLFKQFADDGVFYYEIPDCIFKFSNAFVDRNIKLALAEYEDLRQTEDGPIMILSVLYNSIRNILLIQMSNNPTAEALGFKNEKQFNALKYKPKRYTSKELERILLLISEVDYKIKRGEMDEEISIEYLMTKVM